MISARPSRTVGGRSGFGLSANHWAMQRWALRVVLALAAGGLALIVTQGWVASRSAAATDSTAGSVDILVTSRPLSAGHKVEAADLRWQRWPTDAVAPGWRQRGMPGTDFVGLVAANSVAPGVPITADLLAPLGSGGSFAAAIPPGMRAISIAVTPAAGLAGFAEPGDRVDILLTQTIGGRRTAQVLLGDVGVLGVDQKPRGNPSPLADANDVVADAMETSSAGPPELVTLEVTPQQAQAVAIAAEIGRLSLALRGPVRDTGAAAGRRWDSDVTGLSSAQLTADSVPRLATPAVVAPVVTAAASSPSSGIEIVYGITPAAPEAAK